MLGNRLKQVASYVQGETLADIGSDHAYLPIYLIEENKIAEAVAGEVVEGPYQAAKKNVAAHGMSDRIAVRKGSGLEVIEGGEVDCITICGMGGPLIATILLDGREKLISKPRLVLQSNIHTAAVREALQILGYQIIEEAIVKERRHIYEIVVAVAGEMKLSDNEMKFGPLLMKEKNELFLEKWMREYDHLRRVYDSIKDNPMQPDKAMHLQKDINQLEEVLNNDC